MNGYIQGSRSGRLRADMDALLMEDASGRNRPSKLQATSMNGCGDDRHTLNLLATEKLVSWIVLERKLWL